MTPHPPKDESVSNEQRYYDTLRRIAKMYDSPEGLRRQVDRGVACTDSFEDFLTMAYENIKFEAERAIKGKRRPKS